MHSIAVGTLDHHIFTLLLNRKENERHDLYKTGALAPDLAGLHLLLRRLLPTFYVLDQLGQVVVGNEALVRQAQAFKEPLRLRNSLKKGLRKLEEARRQSLESCRASEATLRSPSARRYAHLRCSQARASPERP